MPPPQWAPFYFLETNKLVILGQDGGVGAIIDTPNVLNYLPLLLTYLIT